MGGLAPSPDEIELEVDDEVQHHLEMRAKDFERDGLDQKAARTRARRRFGDVDKLREEMMHIKNGQVRKAERIRYWDEVRQDIGFGLRQLVRKPALPLMILVLLAIGVGANTAIFSVVKAVMLERLPYESPDRLVRLWETSGKDSGYPVSFPNFLDWREQTQSLEDVAVFKPRNFNLTGKEGAERVPGSLVSAGIFEILGIEPELGRTLTPEEDQPGGPPVVLISHGLWQRRFGGDSDIIDGTIHINGQAHNVIGIMPADFELPSPWKVGEKFDLWMSFHIPSEIQSFLMDRRTHWLATVARLKDGVSIEAAQEELNGVAKRLEEQYPDTNSDFGIQVRSLHEDVVGRAGGSLLMLLGAAGLVLLIVCGNVAGILMAKATTRKTEVALRSALGASRARLTRQLLMENLPLTLLGGGLGFVLAVWGIETLRSILPTNIPRIDTVGFDGWVFSFTLGISLATGIVFSLVPALAAAKIDLAESLKQGRGSALAGTGRSRVTNLLVVAQFAMTLVLANAAALMLQSYFELRNRDYGFNTDEVLTLGLTILGPEYEDLSHTLSFWNDVIERVNALPGVRYAGATTKLPLEGGTNTPVQSADGHDFSQTEGPVAEISTVTADYFQAMGIPLLAGSKFSERNRSDGQATAIINKSLAEKLWPNEDPIGKRFSIGPPEEWTVAGVVGDVRQYGPERSPIPEIYTSSASLPVGLRFVKYLVVRTDMDPLSLVGAIRREVSSVDANQPISDIRTTAGILGSALARRRFNTLLIGIFATIGLALVAAGIYGVMSFFVAQRTHEIGIRVALGSSRGRVLNQVLGQGLKLAAVGVSVGLVGVLATTKLTESMVYGVSPTDAPTLVFGTLFLVTLGLLGSMVPALRATRVDPILALREE